MHLNSDIYTQAVTLKLKNRDNKLYRVLKSSLRKIKITSYKKNRWKTKINQIKMNLLLIKYVIILLILCLQKNNKKNKDPLNNLLLNFYPSAENLKINVIKRSFNIELFYFFKRLCTYIFKTYKIKRYKSRS